MSKAENQEIKLHILKINFLKFLDQKYLSRSIYKRV